MKTMQCILIALAAILLLGCRPGRMVTEKRVKETDSTAVWVLKDSLRAKSSEIASLRSNLKRVREDNTSLLSEGLHYEIQYDTTAPFDSMTGKPPVMSERITALISRQEKTVSTLQLEQREWSLQRESLLRENSNLLLSLDKLTREHSELKEQAAPSSPFNLRLLLAGIILGILVMGWLMLRRKY